MADLVQDVEGIGREAFFFQKINTDSPDMELACPSVRRIVL